MKVGLVFSGGGDRGAYQIGVWKGLRELGIERKIKAISGVSIGALNGVLFINGNYNKAVRLWSKIDESKILPCSKNEIQIRKSILAIGNKKLGIIKKNIPKAIIGGNISTDGIKNILDEFSLGKICESKIKFYVACTKVPILKSKYFLLNNKSDKRIRDILLASVSLPVIYEKKIIKGKEYLDGGITDNVPIKPLYEMKCDIIIVVHLWRESIIDRNLYPNSRIIELRPSNLQSDDLARALDFNVDVTKELIKRGYRDTIDTFKGINSLMN